jgi:hypothetical protein
MKDWPREEGFARRLSNEINRGSKQRWTPIDPLDRGTTDDPDLRYAEFVYFHPFARELLYPRETDGNAALAILARRDVRGVEVTLQGGSAPLLFDVERIHLYLFRSQTAMLVVEVASTIPVGLHDALQFADQFRRAYAPYHWQGQGGHCPVRVRWLTTAGAGQPLGPESDYCSPETMRAPVIDSPRRKAPIAAHWGWLLEPLTTPGAEGRDAIALEQLEDDRIPTMTWYGIDDPFGVTRGDFVRMCFCDEAGDSADLPYGHGFLADFERRFCYDRYWNPPTQSNLGSLSEYVRRKNGEWRSTRYLCSGYNLSVVSKPAGYGEEILKHFRHHYFQIGLLAHFHRASLLKYSRRLNEAAAKARQEVDGDRWEELKAVRREFAEFINESWFREVSNQEQGKELFRLWSERLGNQDLFAQLRDEAMAADRILNAQEEERRQKQIHALQNSTDRLTRAIFWLAGLTLVIAFLDTELIRTFAEHGGKWFWQRRWDDDFGVWWPLVLLTGLGVGAGFLILRWRMKKLFAQREVDGAHQG